MADYCALCGSKLPFFGAQSLVCANEYEMFCSACYDKLYPMDILARCRYLLEHGKPANPEAIQEFIPAYEKQIERHKELEPPTRPCPNCGSGMECKLKEFRIGAYADKLFGDSYDVDLFACPTCGKVELYTANFARIQANRVRREMQAAAKATTEESAPAEQEFISYRPGQNSGSKPPWEK